MYQSHSKKCEHELKYCEQCNIVYCVMCKEEWTKPYFNYTYTPGTEYTTSTKKL